MAQRSYGYEGIDKRAVTDIAMIERLSAFNRERIPERVVHAKGAGAYGEFEVTHDVSDICSIDMFSEVGKKTPCLTRFSTTAGEKGSADAMRDPRGFACKFYTNEGNWDWVWNNVPFFFIRDPLKFPSLVHSQKRHPSTNLRDANPFWEWVLANQESVHMIMWLFSEFGTFSSFRKMNGYQGHCHKWTKPDGSFVYVHMFLEADQGHEHNTDQEAEVLGGNPDHATKDLYDAIERGDYPSWTAFVQVVHPEDMDKFGFNIFDMTKHWDQGYYPKTLGAVPRRQFGKLTLKRNPKDYNSEIELAAFSPGRLVPGIEPTADPLLQARLFAYPDAQLYRLGPHHLQLPVNAEKGSTRPTGTTESSGYNVYKPQDTSSEAYKKWVQYNEKERAMCSGDFFDFKDIDVLYPRKFWHWIKEDTEQFDVWQPKLVSNVARHLWSATPSLRQKVYAMFKNIEPELGNWVEKDTETMVKEKEAEEAMKAEQARLKPKKDHSKNNYGLGNVDAKM